MRNPVIALSILLLFFSACNETPEDTSLSMKELQKLGMPDCDKTWTAADYSIANAVLLKVKNNQPYALPVKGSKKSGKVFAKLIDIENLSFLQNNSIPLHKRAYMISNFLGVNDDLINIYTNQLMKKQYYNRELVHLYIFWITVTQKMLDLADKINESDIPEDKEMQKGYESIQMAYLISIDMTLENQRKISQYHCEDSEVLTDSLINSIKRNMNWFDEGTSKNLKQKLSAVIGSTSSVKTQNGYKRLIKSL